MGEWVTQWVFTKISKMFLYNFFSDLRNQMSFSVIKAEIIQLDCFNPVSISRFSLEGTSTYRSSTGTPVPLTPVKVCFFQIANQLSSCSTSWNLTSCCSSYSNQPGATRTFLILYSQMTLTASIPSLPIKLRNQTTTWYNADFSTPNYFSLIVYGKDLLANHGHPLC